MKQVAIGIDIGVTNIVLGLVDQNGNVLAKDYFSTAKYNDITEYNVLSNACVTMPKGIEKSK